MTDASNLPMRVLKTDYLVIGSGLAGLSFALKAANLGKSVIIVTKASLDSAQTTNSAMAQGGIAAVSLETKSINDTSTEDDSFEKHIEDTLIAGAGLCHRDVVENFVRQAPERIRDLKNWGVNFKDDLTREGGHSARRIYHFEDQTGLAIYETLLARARQAAQIKFIENSHGIDLILNQHLHPFSTEKKCIGAYFLDRKTEQVFAVQAENTFLATGGAGKVYLYTSNWSGATGDGIAMAYRAGARVANLEFMQFHPTCLYHPQARNFLISEALRGEGGELINSRGEKFMKKYHPLGNLAPRDIVARSIDAEMKKSADACVYLDMTHLDADFVRSRFPAIYARCLELGIDATLQPIPVVPAAHYLCGGVVTNLNGQTDVANLFALGETACTGFHGANRLASNSLLECLTTSHNASEFLREQASSHVCESNLLSSQGVGREQMSNDVIPQWIYPTSQNDADEMVVISHMWDEIRHLMWNYVGIVRSNKRLERAKHRLQNILAEVQEYYANFQLHPDILELRNIAIVADLTIECALRRHESRGIHFNLDYPATNSGADLQVAKDTICDSSRRLN